MSTTLYLRCVSHDPYLESGPLWHNLSGLDKIRELVRDREKMLGYIERYADAEEYWTNYFTSAHIPTLIFIKAHPHCDYELWDEYGKQYSLEVGSGDKPLEPVESYRGIIGTIEFGIVDGAPGIFIRDLTEEGRKFLEGAAEMKHLSIYKKEDE